MRYGGGVVRAIFEFVVESDQLKNLSQKGQSGEIMNRATNPLFQWSLAIALLSGFLARVLLQSESPLAAMSLGVQSLTAVLLSLLPLTGIVLGVLSWKRKELKAGWIIAIIVFNAVQFLLIFLRLFFVLQG